MTSTGHSLRCRSCVRSKKSYCEMLGSCECPPVHSPTPPHPPPHPPHPYSLIHSLNTQHTLTHIHTHTHSTHTHTHPLNTNTHTLIQHTNTHTLNTLNTQTHTHTHSLNTLNTQTDTHTHTHSHTHTHRNTHGRGLHRPAEGMYTADNSIGPDLWHSVECQCHKRSTKLYQHQPST